MAVGSVIGKTLNLGYPGSVSRSADAIIENRAVSVGDTIAINFGAPVALNQDNTYSAFGAVATTLQTALATGTAYTSLTVAALSNAIQSGATVTLGAQTTTVDADADAGATTISVASFTTSAAYAVGTAVTVTNVASQFAGIAVREVKQSTNYLLQTQGGSYTATQPCDALQRGSITVTCQNGTPVAGGSVWVRVATNAAFPNAVVGGFEAVADGANSVQLTSVQWKTGSIDANLTAELTILSRSKA